MVTVKQAQQIKLSKCKFYFHECKTRSIKFKARNLRRLNKEIDASSEYDGGSTFQSILSAHMEYIYEFDIRILPDESDIESYNPFKEALFRENYLLKCIKKSTEWQPVSVSIPLIFTKIP